MGAEGEVDELLDAFQLDCEQYITAQYTNPPMPAYALSGRAKARAITRNEIRQRLLAAQPNAPTPVRPCRCGCGRAGVSRDYRGFASRDCLERGEER